MAHQSFWEPCVADRAPRPEQLEAAARRWASEMIERLRPGDALPAQLEINCKIMRNYVLPVLEQLTASRAHPVGGVAGQLPTPAPLTVGESVEVPERSGATGSQPHPNAPQLAPNFAECDPATLAWCGQCGPLSDGNGWGFDRSTRRPCKRPGCQLGRYRAWRVAQDRGAEEAATAERDEAADVDPKVAELAANLASAKGAKGGF